MPFSMAKAVLKLRTVKVTSSWEFKMDISVFRISYMYPAACLLAATQWSCLFEGDLRIAKRHCSAQCIESACSVLFFLLCKIVGMKLLHWSNSLNAQYTI